MDKKFNSKSFVLGMIVAILLVSIFSNSTLAKSTMENIEVLYNNIKLIVDGKPVTFGKDLDGKQVEPFIYKGTTYLPVRAVGEALGKEVDWDGKNQTVYVGGVEKGKKLMTEEIEPHSKAYFTVYNAIDSKKLNIAGKDYSTGYEFVGYGTGNRRVNFNLNSQYEYIEFDIGPSGNYGDNNKELIVYKDGVLSETMTINGNDGIKTVKLPVKGVNQLRIEATGGYPAVGIGDPMIK